MTQYAPHMQSKEQVARRQAATVRYLLLGTLLLALVYAVAGTRSWPLVGDAALMHYVVFLSRGGAVPYRDIVDINLPGTYLLERAAMAVFGAGAWGLRLYDWFLLLGVAAGCFAFTGRRRWFAAGFAALLFALIHLQDGIAQQGQRDLVLAILLLGGLGAFRLILEGKRHVVAASLIFGLTFGLSLTIKPVLLPIIVSLLLYALWKRTALCSAFPLVLATSGLLLPTFLMGIYLYRHAALHSFLAVSRFLLPLHASLGRKPFSYLLTHSFSPLEILVVFFAALLWLCSAGLPGNRFVMCTTLAGTLAAYVMQGKGYPYQRYPFVCVLLLAIGLTLDAALDVSGKTRGVAWLMACWVAGLGIYSAHRAVRYSTATPFVDALSTQLATFGTPEQLNSQVQCLDTFGGCINTLYDRQIRQSTGFLYDCYLFTGPSPARTLYRQQFWAAFEKARPRLIVLTSQNCFADFSNGYGRVDTWPTLSNELQGHYHQVGGWSPAGSVSWFSQKEMPFGLRLLLRNNDVREP